MHFEFSKRYFMSQLNNSVQTLNINHRKKDVAHIAAAIAAIMTFREHCPYFKVWLKCTL